MDPNAALREIRWALSDWRDGIKDEANFDRLAEHVEALDEWLTKGGFLPGAWESAPRRVSGRDYDLSEIQPLGGFARSQLWREAEASARLDGETHVVGGAYTAAEPLGGPVPGADGSHLPEHQEPGPHEYYEGGQWHE